jgi:hypothetical protein
MSSLKSSGHTHKTREAGPERLPWSRSACRTHLRKVSAVHPILLAIETIAAHCVFVFPLGAGDISAIKLRER